MRIDHSVFASCWLVSNVHRVSISQAREDRKSAEVVCTSVDHGMAATAQIDSKGSSSSRQPMQGPPRPQSARESRSQAVGV